METQNKYTLKSLRYVTSTAALLVAGAITANAVLLSEESYLISDTEGEGYKLGPNMQSMLGHGQAKQNHPPDVTAICAYGVEWNPSSPTDPTPCDMAYDKNPYAIGPLVKGSLNYGLLRTNGANGGKWNPDMGGLETYFILDTSTDGPFKDYTTDGKAIGDVPGILYVSYLFALKSAVGGDNQALFMFADAIKNRNVFIVGKHWHDNEVKVDKIVVSGMDTQTHLVVFKFDFKLGAKDSIKVWYDPLPTLSDDQSDTANYETPVFTATNKDYNFNAFKIKPMITNGVYFDEFRMGTTLSDVLPLAKEYGLTITAENGTVTSDPEPDGGLYIENTVVKLTATPANGYRFKQWTGEFGDADPTKAVIDVTMTDDLALTAEFEVIPTYDLTLTIDLPAGATVSVEDEDLNFVDFTADQSFDEGEELVVTVTVNSGYTFLGVTYAGTTKTLNPQIITVTESGEITVHVEENQVDPPVKLFLDVTHNLGSGWYWQTDVGYLYGGFFPYNYYIGSSSWIWVYQADGITESIGFYFWDYKEDSWGWTNAELYPESIKLPGSSTYNFVD